MKLRRRFLLLALACAGATSAHADEAGETLVKSFIDRIDKHDAWSASAARISSEGTATVVEGLTIARADGPARLDAAKLRLDKLAEEAGGGIAIDALSASGLKFGGAEWSFDIPEASGRGISTAGFGSFSFDPTKPFTSIAQFYTALAETEFDEVVIPKAAFSQETADGGSSGKTKAEYVNFRLDSLKKGMLSGQSIERIESVTAGATPEPVTTTFAGLSIKNFDLAAFAHVFDPAAYAGGKGDGLWKMAFESAGYAKVSAKNGAREVFSAGPITTSGWQIRQTAQPFAPLFDELFAAGKPGGEELNGFMQEHIAALLGWFKIGSVSVKSINAYPPEGGKVALASASIEDLSTETMKQFAIDAFAFEGPKAVVKLQKLEIGDVIWPSVDSIMALARLEDAKETGGILDPALIDQVAGSAMGIFPRIGNITIAGVEIGMPGGEPFKLGEYTATSEGGMALLPKLAKAKLSQIVIPLGILHASPEMGEIFDALGYSEIVIDGEGEASHDEASGRYSGTGRIAVKDAGAVSVAHAFGGLTTERIKAIMVIPLSAAPGGEPDQAQLITALAPISIDSFTFRFDDASLIRRLLPLAARMQGMDEATLIGNTTAMLQIGLAALGNQIFTTEVVTAVGSFLKEPKSLTIALRPAKPVTIQELMSLDPSKPGAAIDLLGVHVTAND